MELVMVMVTGVLFAAGVYALLSTSLFRALLGIMLISQAANLAVFNAGGLTEGAPAMVVEGQDTAGLADPLPQALVLTAIVIGLGVAAFSIALFAQVARSEKTDKAANELMTGDPAKEQS